jgi:hypothetical protein
VVPDNEGWLHRPAAKTDLDAALARARANPANDGDVDAVLATLHGEG